MENDILGTIYEDVAELQEQVAALQSAMAQVQGQINNLAPSDSGWIVLPLAGDVQAYSDDLTPKYRKIGKEVFLTGVVKNITQANTVLAQLPTGFRPIRQTYFIAGSSTLSNGVASFYNCQINADGNVRITTHSSATYNANHYLRLNGSFLID